MAVPPEEILIKQFGWRWHWVHRCARMTQFPALRLIEWRELDGNGLTIL